MEEKEKKVDQDGENDDEQSNVEDAKTTIEKDQKLKF